MRTIVACPADEGVGSAFCAFCQLLRTCANSKIFTPSLRYFLSEIFISGIWKARCDYCYREIRFCGGTKDESKQDKTRARRNKTEKATICRVSRRVVWGGGCVGWAGGWVVSFSYIYMLSHTHTLPPPVCLVHLRAWINEGLAPFFQRAPLI